MYLYLPICFTITYHFHSRLNERHSPQIELGTAPQTTVACLYLIALPCKKTSLKNIGPTHMKCTMTKLVLVKQYNFTENSLWKQINKTSCFLCNVNTIYGHTWGKWSHTNACMVYRKLLWLTKNHLEQTKQSILQSLCKYVLTDARGN